MLYELEPAKELTGGPWYGENAFDSEFISVLQEVRGRGGGQGGMQAGTWGYCVDGSTRAACESVSGCGLARLASHCSPLLPASAQPCLRTAPPHRPP